jgi:mannosyltransferase OCH1-like enzyme
MFDLSFEDLDRYLLQQKGRIIHQIWFGTIPNKRVAKKAYEKLKRYRDSWKIKNPSWCHVEWNKDYCYDLIKYIYPEHTELYKQYKYQIQRCDAIRYFILHRYGGLYADMDYFCNRPFDEVLENYQNDIYFVQSPNSTIGQDNDHISNSLMYSKPNNPFWKKIFIELEQNKTCPYFYTKHMHVMFTTGPAFLNRIYSKYKYRFRVKSYPHRYFHPFGLKDDILSLKLGDNVYAAHIGKGSWEESDSKVLIGFVREWKVLLSILLVLILPCLIYAIVKRK